MNIEKPFTTDILENLSLESNTVTMHLMSSFHHTGNFHGRSMLTSFAHQLSTILVTRIQPLLCELREFKAQRRKKQSSRLRKFGRGDVIQRGVDRLSTKSSGKMITSLHGSQRRCLEKEEKR